MRRTPFTVHTAPPHQTATRLERSSDEGTQEKEPVRYARTLPTDLTKKPDSSDGDHRQEERRSSLSCSQP